MAAPGLVHELLDRAWDMKGPIGQIVIRKAILRREGSRFVAEFGNRRIATPFYRTPDRDPIGNWLIAERKIGPWVEAEIV